MPDSTPKERIMEAALEVIGERTLSGTRMQMIADKAGMSTSNLVYHYRSMKELMGALLEYISETFDRKLAPILEDLPDNFTGKLHGFLDMQKVLVEKEKVLDRIPFDFWSQGLIDPDINQFIMNLYASWRQGYVEMFRTYYPELGEEKIEILSQVLLSMLLGASLQFSSATGPYDLDAYLGMCEKMLDLLLQDGLK